MAENQTKTNRQLVNDRLGAKYPGTDWSDDEQLYGQIDKDYSEYESQIGGYKEREAKLTDLFAKDPRAAQFFVDLSNGKDPWLSAVKRLGIDNITEMLNDPAKQDELAEANKQYVERIAEEGRLTDEYNKNFEDSMAIVERMQQEQGLSDENIDAAFDFIMKIAHEAIVGKFTEETINMALKSINHDSDVSNARSEGVVAGRNQKIVEGRRKAASGDGMPQLGGSNNAPQKPKQRSFFDFAEAAQ